MYEPTHFIAPPESNTPIEVEVIVLFAVDAPHQYICFNHSATFGP